MYKMKSARKNMRKGAKRGQRKMKTARSNARKIYTSIRKNVHDMFF